MSVKFSKGFKILGIPFSNLDYDMALEYIIDNAKCVKKYIKIYTPNVDFAIKAHKSQHFLEILNRADLTLADGMPLVWASKFLGNPLKGKISGSSLFFKLCSIAEKNNIKIFLLGGLPNAAEIASKQLTSKYGDIISGTYCPNYGFIDDPDEVNKIIKLISKSGSNVVVVGLGAPLQEVFIDRFSKYYKVPVSMGLGGTIDFASGLRKMPPEFIKNFGMGWFWRLILEPKRLWKRYLIDDMKFFYYLYLQKIKRLPS